MKILITGGAGFLGSHIAQKLYTLGHDITIIDNLNDYYNPALKIDRLNNLPYIPFSNIDITDKYKLNQLFENKFDVVYNLAAQAGVRYSIENPQTYIDNNINGFFNILECCKDHKVKHLIFASSSSVYGNTGVPFSENNKISEPLNLYAATKQSNELMAYSYSHVYNMNVTGLRFFTVYGPWGRPDMAYYSFTNRIDTGKKINVFNKGDLLRDFTYIDDAVNAAVSVIKPNSKYNIYNIGNNSPVRLIDFIRIIESLLNKKAKIRYQPMQTGDAYCTYADITKINKDYNYSPETNIKEGLSKFVEWYKNNKGSLYV